MPDHPSLTAPPVLLPTLQPNIHASAEAPCWCHSKLSFGACHKNREHAKRPHEKSFAESIKQMQVPRTCAHPDAPSGCTRVINAHTIQRNGGLDALVENDHVTELILEDGNLDETRRGTRLASTFEGFCGTHDGALFKPIEAQGRRFDMVAAHLFAFRALAYTQHRKEIALKRVARYRELDAGLPLEGQVIFQRRVLAMQVGSTQAIEDLRAMKNHLTQMYRSNNYSGLHAATWIFSEILPLAYAGAFYPEHDFFGKPLQRLCHGDATFETVCATLTPWEGKTLLGFAWTGEFDGPAERYVRSFKAIPDGQKADAAMRAGFENQENLMMRTSWWTNLCPTDRKTLEALRMAGTETGPNKVPSVLANVRSLLSEAGVEAMLQFDGEGSESN